MDDKCFGVVAGVILLIVAGLLCFVVSGALGGWLIALCLALGIGFIVLGLGGDG